MGRDEAVADRLQYQHQLYIIGQWKNPGLVAKAEASGGEYFVANDMNDVQGITDIVERIQPDMFLTNFDSALAAGIVDALEDSVRSGTLSPLAIPCPSRAAARIEWDKFYLRELVAEVAPDYNPTNFMAEDEAAVREAIAYFQSRNTEIAIKPRGLTGGKGVKVMGKHFDTYDEATDYALKCVAGSGQNGVEVQEKMTGHEFTLQLLTDGTTIIEPPVTYDYPYREDGNTGPGTGGMGTFTMRDGLMPFLDHSDYTEAIDLSEKILKIMREKGITYKGVLYTSFFKTPNGLKIVETNARGGDPELINIVDLMTDNVDLAAVLLSMANGDLTEDQVRFQPFASAMIYLVSPDYGFRSGEPVSLDIDTAAIEAAGVKLRFAATENVSGSAYRTVGSSRSVGLAALGEDPWDARDKLLMAIETGFEKPLVLDFRLDVAHREYIEKLVS